jgi:pimeloyl-ACP methyl ester carboxylesterase
MGRGRLSLKTLIVRGLLGLAILLLAIVALALGFRAFRQNAIARDLTLHTPRAVQEAMYVRLGGVDQWVQIRGEDRDNPVLLFVHGGPGNAVSPFASLLRPWEKDFTVVIWDQRCAGKTFARGGIQSCQGMSLARVAADGVELSEFLRQRLHKSKIVVLGHSWGTMVGLRMVHDHPDLYSAYVGTGQVISIPEKEPVVYDRAMAMLRGAHDEAGVRALLAVGRPPYRSSDDLMTERSLSLRHDAPAERDLFMRLASVGLVAPGWSLRDAYRYFQAGSPAEAATFADTNDYDARALGPTFQIPIFVFSGADDNVTPAALAQRYVEGLKAPKAEFVSLPGAGHNAVLTEPEVFLHELNTRVRPIAVRSQ